MRVLISLNSFICVPFSRFNNWGVQGSNNAIVLSFVEQNEREQTTPKVSNNTFIHL